MNNGAKKGLKVNMLSILIDTNVAVDFIVHRMPFYEESAKVIEAASLKIFNAYISASCVTDIYYIARRELKDRELTLKLLKNFLTIVKVAAVSEKEIKIALESMWSDFEDAVQYSVALSNNMDYIITRNVKDFSASEVPAMTPEAFCEMLLEE